MLKPIYSLLLGVGVVGFAVAGTLPLAPVREGLTPEQLAVFYGNSLVARNAAEIGDTGVRVGGMTTLAAYYSTVANYTLVPVYTGSSSSALYINNANLLLTGQFNDGFQSGLNIGFYQRPNLNGASISNNSTFTVSEAYLGWMGADQPMLVKAGKFYSVFGSYYPDALVPSLTQLFTQITSTGVELGFDYYGFYGMGEVFSGAQTGINTSKNALQIQNWAFKVGYMGCYNEEFQYGLSASWLNNLVDADYLTGPDFSGMVLQDGVFGVTPGNANAWTANAHLLFSGFDVTAEGAGATQSLIYSGFNGLGTPVSLVADKPWVAGIDAGYSFDIACKEIRVGGGYQQSGNSAALFLPQRRYYLNVGSHWNKYLHAQLAWYNDSAPQPGTVSLNPVPVTITNSSATYQTNNMIIGGVTLDL